MTHSPQDKTRKGAFISPKAVVLREEFVALTHDPLVAIVLNQLLYWTQRVKDFDLFLEEERLINPECNVSSRHGWLYKTANDLVEETMLCVDRTTMRRYLKFLIAQGWLEERSNPHNKWDKTSQYRLNLRKIQDELSELGFDLPGIDLLIQKNFCSRNKSPDKISGFQERQESQSEYFTPSNETHSKVQISPSNDLETQNNPWEEFDPLGREKIAPSERLNSPLNIQRLKTEIINKDYSHRLCARESFSNLEKLLVGEPELDVSTLRECDEGDSGWNGECRMKEPASSDCGSGESNLDTSDADKLDFNKCDSKEPGTGESETDKSETDESETDDDADKSGTDNSVEEEMICLWEQHILQKLFPSHWQRVLQRTEERKDQLASLLAFHFKNDVRLWESFCLRVKGTSFLMGGGPNGWTINLDWILQDENLRKVLEGNYVGLDRPKVQKRSARGAEWRGLTAIQHPPCRDAEKAVVIGSIKDPVWKKWCTRLAEGVHLNELLMFHEPLSVSDLKSIANAWFLECEGERFVWIGSNDQRVLNKIDDLRLKITWAFEKEYPKARAFRTRLQPHNIGETHV